MISQTFRFIFYLGSNANPHKRKHAIFYMLSRVTNYTSRMFFLSMRVDKVHCVGFSENETGMVSWLRFMKRLVCEMRVRVTFIFLDRVTISRPVEFFYRSSPKIFEIFLDFVYISFTRNDLNITFSTMLIVPWKKKQIVQAVDTIRVRLSNGSYFSVRLKSIWMHFY